MDVSDSPPDTRFDEGRPYVPEVAPAYWEEVRGFVEDAVTSATGLTPYKSADLFLSVSRLTLWCWQIQGYDLELELIFHRSTIDQFTRVGLPSFNEAARGNIRSQLLRVAEVILDASQAPRRLTPMQASDPSRPYLPREVVELHGWAESQSTAGRRDNAHVLLALGLGAGLSASEIGNLRVGEIETREEGVCIRVASGRQRLVPVLAEWERPLINRTTSVDASHFAFREGHTPGYENVISNFVRRSSRPGTAPQSQRMRATWIVTHLQNGVPVVPLLRAAGVESLDALNRYVRFVAGPAETASMVLLRGRATP